MCLHKVDVNIQTRINTNDTTNILFILGGAFDGIDEVIKRRLGEKVIGFASNEADKYDEEALLEQIRPEDLQSYGLIPEFIGRVPIVANRNIRCRSA